MNKSEMEQFEQDSYRQIDFLFEEEPEKKQAVKDKLTELWEKLKAAKDSETVQKCLDEIKRFLQNEHVQNSLEAGKTLVKETGLLIGDGIKAIASQPKVAEVLEKVKKKVNITITIEKGDKDETNHDL